MSFAFGVGLQITIHKSQIKNSKLPLRTSRPLRSMPLGLAFVFQSKINNHKSKILRAV